MKKLVFIVVGVLVLSVACVYIFIPRTITVVRAVGVSCNAAPIFRIITDEKKWAGWWPNGGRTIPGTYSYNGYQYRLTKLSYYNVDVRLTGQPVEVTGRISVIPVSKDSTVLQWACSFPEAKNLIERLTYYRKAGALGGDIGNVLSRAAAFFGVQKNVYGVAFREGTTTDTYLAAMRKVLPAYPTTKDTYGMIGSIQAYMRVCGAKQTSYPIMNIEHIESGWRTTVSVPTDIPLKGNGTVYFMRLIPAKFLIADVRGGDSTVEAAVQGMNNYILDYRRTVMAMPYRTLVTDRIAEPDTSKWLTTIYCPIF
ncbi:MAG: hypothetical protein JST42_28150 [Bacteroidetes bacterium]|nr:hypothetical protein [Bacteroidota bacterium]